MKTIEIDEELYQYIASQTQQIGESASQILRRLLLGSADAVVPVTEGSSSTLGKTDATEQPKAASKNQPDDSKQSAKGSVFDRISRQDLQAESSIVGRFLLILSALAKTHPKQFAKVLEIKGRDRQYFGRSDSELLQSGSSTNPKAIPDSDFWVITNSNTTRKKMMLTEAALKLGYSDMEAEQIRDLL
ncbi:replication initiation negative regulator SeqA [Alkalimonas sp. MEB108]|uniref:Negative modulator of initiation of replication n=1 Tax=Alkalimonas cellulosilytica TaxID=3058395 RepID=A0ABU7J5X9_9GAMM|nr:replication initiation negative regulator SeqA [Alkalimonas sp. MEB108]MEE2001340.1 replication initiation negative regulator SeqA [Alkalimonas sp. MEB108]